MSKPCLAVDCIDIAPTDFVFGEVTPINQIVENVYYRPRGDS